MSHSATDRTNYVPNNSIGYSSTLYIWDHKLYHPLDMEWPTGKITRLLTLTVHEPLTFSSLKPKKYFPAVYWAETDKNHIDLSRWNFIQFKLSAPVQTCCPASIQLSI